MKKIVQYGLLMGFIAGMAFSSCKRPAAQYPSNKVQSTDSTTVSVLEINRILAQREDSLILDLVSQQTVPFKHTNSGLWYYIEQNTQLNTLKNDSSITFTYTAYSINGEKIKSEKKQITFGKKEIPNGLEEGLKLLRKGDKARFIIPWYLAYGMKGNDEIPPYTSLVYQVQVDE